jgi:BASS family bile acid:Na+ symporter
VFVAAAVPPLGALLRPYITEAILVLLCISFMRVDLAALYGHLRRPALIATATAWTTMGVPLIVGLIIYATGLNDRSPGLSVALMLQSMASPMMASPALAALMGLVPRSCWSRW